MSSERLWKSSDIFGYYRSPTKNLDTQDKNVTPMNYKKLAGIQDLNIGCQWLICVRFVLKHYSTLNGLTTILVFFFKILHKLVNINFPEELEPYYRSEQLHHQLNYRQVSARINTYKNSFFIRTIPVWNHLPACIVNAHVSSFKEQATPFITWM